MFAKNVYESNLAFFLGDFNFDILLTVPDELGELFQARWMQTKLPRIFFNALWEFLSKFGQKAFMSRILHFILVISTLIFCPLCLMLSSFCVAFFVGGYSISIPGAALSF